MNVVNEPQFYDPEKSNKVFGTTGNDHKKQETKQIEFASQSFQAGSIKSEKTMGTTLKSLGGFVFRFVRTTAFSPLYAIEAGYHGMKSAIKYKTLKAVKESFKVDAGKLASKVKTKKIKPYESLKPGTDRAKTIANENIRYARMLKGFLSNSHSNESKFNTSFFDGETIKEVDEMFFEIKTEQAKKINKLFESLERMGLKKGSHNNEPIFYHPESGIMFRMGFDKINNEVFFGFLGMESEKDISDEDKKKLSPKIKKKMHRGQLEHIVKQSLGGVSKSGKQALEIGGLVKKCAEECEMNLVVAGHSHGGGMAQAIGVAHGIKTVTFNARPMGNGMRKFIKKQLSMKQNELTKDVKVHKDKDEKNKFDKALKETNFDHNTENITAFSVKGDWLTCNKVCDGLAQAFEMFTGISVPRRVGKGYRTPEIPRKSGSLNTGLLNHNQYMDSLKRLM